VIAALAIRQPVSEKVLAAAAPVPEGRLAVSHGRVRTRRASVSSPVTAADVAAFGSTLDDSASLTHRQHLEGLQSALADLTAAVYRQTPVRDAATLGEAVRHALGVASDLQRDRNAWSTWWSRR
jgi:hypothetical protein